VPVLVITRGEQGSVVSVAGARGRERHEIPAALLQTPAVDPTGVGDAYRAGLVRGIRIGAPWEVAGRIGSVAAALSLESLGPQPPRYPPEEFRARYGRNFEDEPLLGRLFSEDTAAG